MLSYVYFTKTYNFDLEPIVLDLEPIVLDRSRVGNQLGNLSTGVTVLRPSTVGS